jgi:peptidyl-prolyl cis-trans isomerase SurA
VIKYLALAAALAAPAAAQAAPVDRVIAVVNGDPILQSDLTRARADLEKENALAARSEELADKDLLQRLIDDKLANQEADKLDIQVTDKEVDAAVDDILAQNRMDLETLKARLLEQGVNYTEYRGKILERIRRLKLTNRTVRSRVNVDQSRMQAYYSQHRDEFKDTPKLHLVQAVFSGAKAVAQSNALYKKGTLSQADFEAEAKAAGASVTDLGQLTLERMAPEIARLIDPVEAGRTTPPMEAGAAVQLIFVSERLPARIKSFEEVRGEIEERLGREESERQFNRWLKELRDKSLIEIKD